VDITSTFVFVCLFNGLKVRPHAAKVRFLELMNITFYIFRYVEQGASVVWGWELSGM